MRDDELVVDVGDDNRIEAVVVGVVVGDNLHLVASREPPCEGIVRRKD